MPRVIALPVFAEHAGQDHRRPQLPGERRLRARDSERLGQAVHRCLTVMLRRENLRFGKVGSLGHDLCHEVSDLRHLAGKLDDGGAARGERRCKGADCQRHGRIPRRDDAGDPHRLAEDQRDAAWLRGHGSAAR